ncbi:MAG: glutamate--cysteine ligase [Oligoflexia bacterium]|nr:glutamate--cysteine ligase [Oligoflexia bacterium]
MKDLIHKRLVERREQVDQWFIEKSKGLDFPIYSSVDIRDAGVKLASVDANIFPAGFNNICDVDQENAVKLIKDYLTSHYKTSNLQILLLAEEHTSNKYYWENVNVLSQFLVEAGSTCKIAVPKVFTGSFDITTPKGVVVHVFSATRDGDSVKVSGDGVAGAKSFTPDLIVSNNDFSDPHAEWYAGLKVPMNPSHELGWFRRKKSSHFTYYNELATEFSKIIDVNPWTFTVETELAEVDFTDPSSLDRLAQKTQIFIDRLNANCKASEHKCSEPAIFIKNNRGTYGMGILSVRSGEELISLSQKERKKMGYSKGGQTVHEVILQEGIPTQVSADGDTAEPAIYMVGNQLAGGFLRSHKQKGPMENLNSPGAVFKRLCMSDLMVDVEGSKLENVYGWIARLNALAIGREGQDVGARYE